MRTLGLKARWSPIHSATEDQKNAIAVEIGAAKARGVHTFEVRHSSWIGHGCAADKGAIALIEDGRIGAHVYPDGTVV